MNKIGAVLPYAGGRQWALSHRAIGPFSLAVVGLAVAGLVAGVPPLSSLLLILVWILTLAVVLRASLPSAFVNAAGMLLLGYAAFGKTFAYFGYPPVFVGELVLALGIASVILTPARRMICDTPLAILIVLFSLWGAARTLPFLDEHGVDALRDAVIWGYAAFGLAFAACVRHTGSIAAEIRRYEKGVPIFLTCAPAAFLLARGFGESLPRLPWADVSVALVKVGDIGVHLGGIAGFLLLRLNGGEGGVAPSRFRSVLLFIVWLAFAIGAASLQRGALLAIAAALLVVGLLHPRTVGLRVLGASLMVALIASVLLLTADTAHPPGPFERGVSIAQLAENVRDIFGGRSSYGNLDGTKEWRLEWWREIVNYTVFGREFMGKGFGINLANDDGFQVNEDESLRSPHNIHMAVLARAGVPGLLVWTALNLCFAISMLVGHLQAWRAGQRWWAGVFTWLIAYWAAIVINGTVDVFIEGPMGGLWYWTVMGAGIAVLDAARRDRMTRRLA